MIYFRVDSNSQIASGHVMRCISLAQAFFDQGFEVCFLTADANSDQMIDAARFTHINLKSQWDDLSKEVKNVREIVNNDSKSLLIIDTYAITNEYVEALLPFTKVAYIGSIEKYLGPLQAIINYSTCIDYNFYYTFYDNSTELLLGASYAPLRKEFQNIQEHYSERVENILLTTGNTDSQFLVPKILERLKTRELPAYITINVVIGSMFSNKENLWQNYGEDSQVVLHENVKAMSELMTKCDLAIAANGTTVYELAACGVPTITFAMVKEQILSAEKFGELGITDYCGRIFEQQEKCINKIISKVIEYIEDKYARWNLAHKAKESIDGNGCQKIVQALSYII